MKEYEIIDVDIAYINKNYIGISWGAIEIGYGELVISTKTFRIVDSEFMSLDFCKEVIKMSPIYIDDMDFSEVKREEKYE